MSEKIAVLSFGFARRFGVLLAHEETGPCLMLRADTPLTLNADDVTKLQSLNDPISLDEIVAIYLPLSRLVSLYVEATQKLHDASTRFLGADSRRVPYIIGVAGSVAVGKSTTARVLQALLKRRIERESATSMQALRDMALRHLTLTGHLS